MKTEIVHIPGAFQGDIVLETFASAKPDCSHVVINLHGTYGSRRGSSGKYARFAERIAESGLAHVVLYDSSRAWNRVIDPAESYEQKQYPFLGKNFEHEVEDAIRAVRYIRENGTALLGSSATEITLQGNSLGGILAFYAAEPLGNIRNIVTVGTWLRKFPADMPILSTFPPFETVLAKAGAFTGNFWMHQWTSDEVFSPESFDELYEWVVGAKEKRRSAYSGVNHGFSSIGGAKNDEPFEAVARCMLELLEHGIKSDDGDGVDDGNDARNRKMKLK